MELQVWLESAIWSFGAGLGFRYNNCIDLIWSYDGLIV